MRGAGPGAQFQVGGFQFHDGGGEDLQRLCGPGSVRVEAVVGRGDVGAQVVPGENQIIQGQDHPC